MSITVYQFPPVDPRLWRIIPDYPTQKSVSGKTGARFVSFAGRRRRRALLEAHGRRDFGAGHSLVLTELLRGGENAVRIDGYPVNFHLDATRDAATRRSVPVDWTDDGVDVEWTDGGIDVSWFSGSFLTGSTGTDGQGFPRIIVSGLPPSALVGRPGEYLTAYAAAAGTQGTTVMIMRETRSDANGNANFRLLTALPALTDVRVNIGTFETGVYFPTRIPDDPQPVDGDWALRWEFQEIFADEVGGFTEVDPWS